MVAKRILLSIIGVFRHGGGVGGASTSGRGSLAVRSELWKELRDRSKTQPWCSCGGPGGHRALRPSDTTPKRNRLLFISLQIRVVLLPLLTAIQ